MEQPNKLKVKWIVPGLDTINTPIKPIKTAAHLLSPTFSLRKKKDLKKKKHQRKQSFGENLEKTMKKTILKN